MNSHRAIPQISRRGLLASAAAVGGIAATGGLPAAAATSTHHHGPSPHEIARDVKAEFLHGWNGYRNVAWGHDEVHPVSGTAGEFFVDGHPIGLSIIEALDTFYVMELDDELAAGVKWIDRNVDFDIDGDFHVFEAIIRVVGGLLAGYLASGERKLLRKCGDLTDRLLPAFTKSPTGIPYTHVNLHTGAVSGPTPPLAEVGTNILEFGVLSQLTGDSKYYEIAKKAYRSTIERRSSLNLLGTFINVETGAWTDTTDTAPNPPVDSFYEYLWGAVALFNDHDARRWYRMLTDAIIKNQAERYNGHLWFKQVDYQTGALAGRGQSELAAFYAELLSAGGDRKLGEDYYRSWTAVMQRYPVIPEGIDYTTFAATSTGNQLRPEYVNSSFDLYFQTGKKFYRTTAYQYFQAMKTYNRVPGGYTILNDVTTRPMVQGDLTPAYWFAENMKYLYLMFADSPRFDSRHYVLSTEGKVLRGLKH